MIILGISSMFHDASVTVIEDGKILFAGHAERYSKNKNDRFLNKALIRDALKNRVPDYIVYHENSFLKKLRLIRAGNWQALKEPTQQQWVNDFYPEITHQIIGNEIGLVPTRQFLHHETHAAAGVLTSTFDECAVVVLDAIGEFDTASIWHWRNGKLKKKHSTKFPSSLGLFYSAATHYVGLKPNEDEYILMGMAAYGKPTFKRYMEEELFKQSKNPIDMTVNLQRGLTPNFITRVGTKDESGHYSVDYDIAASAQAVVEDKIFQYALKAQQLTGSKNLVFMGGVALNCVANRHLFKLYDNIHIMPNPGDAGSSLGAAALQYYKLTGNRVEWQGPYLGYNIQGKYPVKKALRSLERGEIFGIANGRAEFGPRALGNRSLLADPRGGDIKDRMNAIKKRQKFRPFAPVILEEHCDEYFEMPVKGLTSPYMQFVAKCKYPELFPAIIHADGTSRVQTVNKEQHPGLYELLTKFYKRTGCPMLVNTSLNIKGQPIVNDEKDAAAFAEYYGVKVHTHDGRR
jgi:carbamoyltransferase